MEWSRLASSDFGEGIEHTNNLIVTFDDDQLVIGVRINRLKCV
jgi:hypothetical protein